MDPPPAARTGFAAAAVLGALAASPAAITGRPAAPSASGSAPGRRVPLPVTCPDTLPVLVSRPYAEDAGLSTGDRLRISARADSAGCPGTVAGVYEPPADPYRLTEERPRVLLHLPHLAALSGRADQVDRFSVALTDSARAEGTTPVLESLLPGTRVLETEEAATRTSTTFRVVERFHRAIGAITIAAGGVFLACIMVLKVQARRREVAALRLVGLSRRTLLGWIVSETAVVALVGGVLGVGLGRAASWVINTHYRDVYDTPLAFSTLTAETAATGLVLAVGLGLAAGAVAAGRLLWIDPLEEVER